MERREDIRAAMHSLLTSARGKQRPERRPGSLFHDTGLQQRPGAAGMRMSPGHEAMLSDLQDTLGQHGICAEQGEILQALLDALADRPAVYRGLLAAYLLVP